MSRRPMWTEKAVVTALVALVCGLLFVYVNDANARLVAQGRPFVDLKSAIDDHIPFIPEFIYFYYLYYVWVLLVVPLAWNRRQFYHLAAAFCAIQTAAVLTFLLVPSHMSRPDVAPGGLTASLVRWIYHVDPGFNLLPSLHVGHSALVALAYWTYRPKYFPVVAAGTLLIASSTVFVKQHYLIDVPFGFLFAACAFYGTAPLTRRVRQMQLEALSNARSIEES